MVQVDDWLRQTGYDDRPAAGRPVAPLAELPLVGAPGAPTVFVAGYRPQYNKARQLWYADVAINSEGAFWPFLRLAGMPLPTELQHPLPFVRAGAVRFRAVAT